jgi:dinuclear metal center YbgI/SA1388 family protein
MNRSVHLRAVAIVANSAVPWIPSSHMPRTADVLADLDDLLQTSRFQDHGPNGLQVPGPEEVGTVVTGVSANAELFERAADAGADLVLVHHGLFWGGPPRALDVPAKRRLKLLFDADMALAAYHLPLDAHPEIGNNALLARALGADGWTSFAEHRGSAIGVAATFPADGIPAPELLARVRAATGREPLAFLDGPPVVRRAGIVSGAGGDHLDDAIALGLDALVTGEASERHMALAREGGVHFLAAGHYATETFGIRALGDRLAERFGVEHVFIDVPNPI